MCTVSQISEAGTSNKYFRARKVQVNLYGMHPVVCLLQKDAIWDSRTTNKKKERVATNNE
jgi:hypothetical protein